MDAARWLPATVISQNYAVREAALFRYSQRGMLGARWDAGRGDWLYDVFRVRELFVHRDTALPAAPASHLGILGEARLAGQGPVRRVDVRAQRQPLHTQLMAGGQARWSEAGSGTSPAKLESGATGS